MSGTIGTIDTRKAVLVVHLALLLISEDIVGFRSFLEAFFSRLIPGILVRVVGNRQLAICFLNFVQCCSLRDSKHFIVITFRHDATSLEQFGLRNIMSAEADMMLSRNGILPCYRLLSLRLRSLHPLHPWDSSSEPPQKQQIPHPGMPMHRHPGLHSACRPLQQACKKPVAASRSWP